MKPRAKMFIGFAILVGIGIVLFFVGAKINTPIAQTQATATAPEASTAATEASAAASVDKKAAQIVHIDVKGGYTPHVSHAQADKPVILELATKNTYDCTASIHIPSLQLRKFLPATGVTSIHIPPQKKGSTLIVLCAMGMYSFDIQFD